MISGIFALGRATNGFARDLAFSGAKNGFAWLEPETAPPSKIISGQKDTLGIIN
jgi:hypothetical protein